MAGYDWGAVNQAASGLAGTLGGIADERMKERDFRERTRQFDANLDLMRSYRDAQIQEQTARALKEYTEGQRSAQAAAQTTALQSALQGFFARPGANVQGEDGPMTQLYSPQEKRARVQAMQLQYPNAETSAGFKEALKGYLANLSGGEHGINPLTFQGQEVPGMGVWVDDKGQPHTVDVSGKGLKPTDVVTQEASTFLSGRGKDMTSKQGQADALRWFATPEGQEQWMGYLEKVGKFRSLGQVPAGQVIQGFTDAAGNPVVYQPQRGGPGSLVTPSGAGGVGKRPTEEALQQTASFEVLKQTAQDILDQAKGAKFIGPVTGRWNALKSKLVDNPDYVTMDANVGRLLETAYALSGKQISEKEMIMLKEKFWSDLTAPKGNFETKMKGYMNWLDRRAGARGRIFRGAGVMLPSAPPGSKGASGGGLNFDMSAIDAELAKRKGGK